MGNSDSKLDLSTERFDHLPKDVRKAQEREIAKTLEGMDKINFKCNRKKRRYTNCVQTYYVKEFLPGKSVTQPCDEVFEAWKSCWMKGLKVEYYDKDGVVPAPTSPMGEFIQEMEDEKKEKQAMQQRQ
jgi:hypothetical protein